MKNKNFYQLLEKKDDIAFIKKYTKKYVLLFITKRKFAHYFKKRFLDEVTKSKVLGVYSLNDELLSKKQEILLKKSLMYYLKIQILLYYLITDTE